MFSFFTKKNTPKLFLTALNLLSLALIITKNEEQLTEPYDTLDLLSPLLTLATLHFPQNEWLYVSAFCVNLIESKRDLAIVHREAERHKWMGAYISAMMHMMNLTILPKAVEDVDITVEMPQHKSRAFLSIDW